MKTILVFAGVFILLGGESTFAMGAPKPPEDLLRFSEVVPGHIYRGAQPTDQGFKDLAKYNIKTVINLREEADVIAHEKPLVESLGMNFISVPLSGFFRPSDKNISSIEQALNNPDLQPIFIHCQHGQDRTGLAIGLFRVFTQKVSAPNSYQEMLDLGFHPLLVGLETYFEDKTGYYPWKKDDPGDPQGP